MQIDTLDWIILAQGNDRFNALVNKTKNLRVTANVEKFLGSWANGQISRTSPKQ
jgi:hypothetical protein